jgi:hypothetical protein
VVAPTLKTSDRYVFAAGDAVTIRTADGAVHRPWTWPRWQAPMSTGQPRWHSAISTA